MRRLQLTAYSIVLLSFIIQLGKHFWPNFAFIQGIRVDYLSPILYFSDVVLVGLFIVYFIEARNRRLLVANINRHSASLLIPLFISSLMLSTFFAKVPAEAWYGVVKLIEMVLFAYITAREIGKKQWQYVSMLMFLIGSAIVAIMAYIQFFIQQNIGGWFYFLGERSFSISTADIAKFDMFGTTVLRPYATFPHPNVLAYFLLVATCFIFFYFRYTASSKERLFIFPVLLVNSIAILLSFSRVILVIFFIGIFILLWRQYRYSRWILVLAGTGILLGLLAIELRFSNTVLFARDILLRVQLLGIASRLIQQNLWIGVGLNNFLYYEAPLQKALSPIFLQPVHNIYFLIFTQLGIIGFFSAAYFLLRTMQRLKRNVLSTVTLISTRYYQIISYLFLGSLIIGLFDHYELTLQQGQLVFAFVIGLAWSKT